MSVERPTRGRLGAKEGRSNNNTCRKSRRRRRGPRPAFKERRRRSRLRRCLLSLGKCTIFNFNLFAVYSFLAMFLPRLVFVFLAYVFPQGTFCLCFATSFAPNYFHFFFTALFLTRHTPYGETNPLNRHINTGKETPQRQRTAAPSSLLFVI